MRYSPALYARSLFEVLGDAKTFEYDSILENFRRTVEKYGDLSRLNSIIEVFEKLVVADNGGRIVEIETARELSSSEFKELMGLFRSEDLVRKSIDPKLVAGVRLAVNGEDELDYSFARKLRKIFTAKI